MKTIAISNHKGGVAKTTTCISLGACLAEVGQRALIVDFDPQANLTLAAGFEPEALDWSIADLLQPGADGIKVEATAAAAIQKTVMPGLDILPADQRLLELDANTSGAPGGTSGYERCLRDRLAPLASRYDYILIDCPPSLGALTIMALTAADLALIPLQCDYFAARGVLNLIAVVEAVRQRTNPALEHALFVTMYDARPTISRQILEKLRAAFADTMFETVIGLDTRLRESAMAHEPVITFAAKTRASQQYRCLASELTRHLKI